MYRFLHHIFVPSENNNYRAKALHLDFLTYYLMFIVLIAVIYKATPLANILGVATDMSISKLHELTNQKRSENGLTPFLYNDSLASAACSKANDMCANNYWAHFGPNGQSPWNFISGTGYKYEFAGENLCKNFMNSEGCVNAWMESASHRENILKGAYKDIGFCAVNCSLQGEETTLVVQMFGKPLGGAIALAKPAQAEDTKPAPTKNLVPIATLEPETPTLAPTEEPTIAPTNVVIAKIQNNPPRNANQGITFSQIFLFNNTSSLFILFLVLALIFDFYYAYKLKVVRFTGKHIAHFIFLAVIITSLFIIRKGAIL